MFRIQSNFLQYTFMIQISQKKLWFLFLKHSVYRRAEGLRCPIRSFLLFLEPICGALLICYVVFASPRIHMLPIHHSKTNVKKKLLQGNFIKTILFFLRNCNKIWKCRYKKLKISRQNILQGKRPGVESWEKIHLSLRVNELCPIW